MKGKSSPTLSVFGVPNACHERRRHDLETFARLLGFHTPFILPDGTRPDVLLIHPDAHTLFLGDAKHVEKPSDRATPARLFGYLGWLSGVPPRFRSPHFFALVHAPDSGCMWATLVRDLVDDADLFMAGDLWVRRLSGDTDITLACLSVRSHSV